MPVSASASMASDRAVITGAGLVCALGAKASEVLDALAAGREGIAPIGRFDARGFACRSAALVSGLDPISLGIPHRDARIMDLPAYMLLKAARDAHDGAGLSGVADRSEIGFFAGMGIIDYDVEDLLPAVLGARSPGGGIDYDAFYSKTYREIYPLWPLSMLNNVSFCQVAIQLDLQGENTVFSPHGDSGALALAEGAKTVRDGAARAVLAGGVSEKVSPISLSRGLLHGMLATGGDDEARCMPFSEERRGSILGEGCGVVVFENEESALQRGARYAAAFSGYGAACEPGGDFTGPTRQAFALAMKGALDDAGISPGEIDLLMAHGDGSVKGDDSEMAAIRDVFSRNKDMLKVYASKGCLGNILAGGPAVDLVLAVEMMRRGVIPAMAGSPSVDARMKDLIITDRAGQARIRTVMINAASVEGQAVSIVVRSVE